MNNELVKENTSIRTMFSPTPTADVFLRRKEFYSAIQRDGETPDSWCCRVNELAAGCRFGSQMEAFVLDKFITGMDTRLFEIFAKERELTIDVILAIAMRTLESKISAEGVCFDFEL